MAKVTGDGRISKALGGGRSWDYSAGVAGHGMRCEVATMILVVLGLKRMRTSGSGHTGLYFSPSMLGCQYCQEVPLGRTDKTADIGGCRR